MHSRPRFPLPLIGFIAIYVVAISASAHLHGNPLLMPYLLQLAVLVVVIVGVHLGSNLSTPLLWCLSVWEMVHMAGGLLGIPAFWPYSDSGNVLYSLVLIPNGLRYDQAVHAYGFGITTWMCWEVLRNSIRKHYGHRLTPTLGIVVLCGAAGMGFGALNEVIEFIATLVLPETNVGDFVNTGWDLVYNTLGALCCCLAIYYQGCRQGDSKRGLPGGG